MTPGPGPVFHKYLTPDPKEKQRILPESTPTFWIHCHFCKIVSILPSIFCWQQIGWSYCAASQTFGLVAWHNSSIKSVFHAIGVLLIVGYTGYASSLVKHVRPGCDRTPSVWAWTQKPQWNKLRQLLFSTPGDSAKVSSYFHVHGSHLNVSLAWSFFSPSFGRLCLHVAVALAPRLHWYAIAFQFNSHDGNFPFLFIFFFHNFPNLSLRC